MSGDAGGSGEAALQHKLAWTDAKLEGTVIPSKGGQPPTLVSTGGCFEEYRNIFDALRRYQAVADQGMLKAERHYLNEIARWSRLQIQNHPKEVRNHVIKQLPIDVESELRSSRELRVHDDALSATHHVKYQMLTAEIEGESGKCFRVTLASGFDPSLRASLATQLDSPLEALDFVNEQHDSYVYTRDGSDKKQTATIGDENKVKRAKKLVTQYIHSLGLTSIGEQDIEKLIAAQQVGFLNQSEFKFALHKSPGGSAESTEGITSPGKPGQRAVTMNTDYHTLNAVVHELFHAVESEKLTALPSSLVEGMTEYFALHASGLTVRRPRDSETPIYADNVRFLRIAFAKGAVSHDDLVRAYFLGDTGPLARLIQGWRRYSNLHEQNSFATTGRHTSPEQLTAMWGQIENEL